MRKALLLAALLSCGPIAMAADNGIYVGGSIGQAQAEFQEGNINLDADDMGFKVIAGIRPLDWLGVEANYVNFGEAEENGVSLEADGLSAFAVGFLAAGPVDLFAKGGLVSWDATLGVDGVGNINEDGTDLAYGIGAQFRVWSLSLRAEYEVFDVEDVENLDMLSVGFTFTFL